MQWGNWSTGQSSVPVNSSYSVTPNAQMSTFSVQAGMSEVLTAPVTTASTGGSATTWAKGKQ